MNKNDYYKVELIRILLSPILLVLVTWFFVMQGWVASGQTGIVWIVVAIQVIASLLGVAIVKMMDDSKN